MESQLQNNEPYPNSHPGGVRRGAQPDEPFLRRSQRIQHLHETKGSVQCDGSLCNQHVTGQYNTECMVLSMCRLFYEHKYGFIQDKKERMKVKKQSLRRYLGKKPKSRIYLLDS